jgi:lipopolysaccharide biosynthesis regulator YciM
MPNEIPAFLQDFMNHRKHMTKQDMNSPAVKKSEALMPAKGTADIEIAIQGIIEKKPKNKIVKKFLETRIEELSKAKMK